jgi:UDP-3-O-[3-hydroxymyristoyl] glucosamine N-acyltransferase
MADPRFFTKSQSFTLQSLCEITAARLHDQSSADFQIEDVAPLDRATSSELSFLDNIRYKDQFSQTKAGACFVHPDLVDLAPANTNLLVTEAPYTAYAKAAQALYPQTMPEASISPQAHIADSAQIGNSCVVEAGAVIQDNAKIGDHCWIEAGAVIGSHVELGDYGRVGPNATISHSIIGKHVRLYPGCRIGQDGFGFAMDPAGFVKVPQLGRVIIEDGVEIGANTTIDRGAGPDTVIGAGTWIDNLVQIGHNVKVGKCCVIVSQAGISGSTVLEDFVVLGGQVGVAGHLHLGKGARIAAQSGLMRNVPAGEEQMGSPAQPMKQYLRQVAALNRLIKTKKS